MGRTIEDSIKYFTAMSKTYQADTEMVSIALEIMRKYQKIQQIITDYVNDDSVGMTDYWMGRIKKVIEDGND